MNKTKYKLLSKLYTKNILTRYVFNRYIDKHEGGDFYSQTIRRIFREKYGINVGYASYGCFDPSINFGSPMEIGNYCSFAANVHFIPGNHPPTDVSTHPFFHRAEFGYVINSGGLKTAPTIVGHDVWIGRDVIILPKCKNIGNGAIVGAGSVVTRDVEPYSIVAGNPAREIRKRFDNETILKLEKSEWYNFSPEELKTAFQYAKDIERFLREVETIRTKKVDN